MRLGTGVTPGRHYAAGGGPRNDQWSYRTDWQTLEGWTQLADLDPDEFPRVGVIDEGWLSILDATTTAGYPDSFPAIGGLIRPFPAELLTSGFRVTLHASGIHPLEITPLVVFGNPVTAKPTAFGYGAWLFHDVFIFGMHIGPALGLAGMGYPPDTFGEAYLFDVIPTPHTSGVPYDLTLTWVPSTGTLSAYFNGVFSSSEVLDFPDDHTMNELWLGVQIDAHWCTPNFEPYNIDPVPSVSSRAAGTLTVESLGRPSSPPP